jgi:hypothetical protein
MKYFIIIGLVVSFTLYLTGHLDIYCDTAGISYGNMRGEFKYCELEIRTNYRNFK